MNEYSDASLEQQRTRTSDNPYSDANLNTQAAGQRRTRLREAVVPALDQNPDEYGRAKQIERQIGVPAPIAARNLIDVERRAKLNEYDALDGTRTGTALQNPEFARLAHDDVANLSDMERALTTNQKPMVTNLEFSQLVREIMRLNPILGGDEARLIAQQRISGFNNDKQNIGLQPPAPTLKNKIDSVFVNTALLAGRAGAGIKSIAADVMNDDSMLASAMRWRDQLDRDARMAVPEMSPTEKGVTSGFTSILAQSPGLALSLATGNPIPALAWAGATTLTDAYGKYRQRGGTATEAGVGSVIEGGVEVATELMPMSFLIKKFGKVGMGQFLTGLLARDAPSEQVATFLQDATDTAIANPNKTWQQFLEERPGAAYETLIATVVQGGVMSAGHAAVEKLAGQGLRAKQAERDQEALTRIVELTKANKVLQRDRPTFEKFMEAAAAEGPVQDIYISANTLMQAAGDALPELMQAVPSIADQIDEAVKVGNGDIRIPVGEFMAGTAANDMATTLLPHLRTSAGGMSIEEAKTFMQDQAEEFKQEAAKILEDQQFTAAFKESAATVEKEILTQLNAANRFNTDVHSGYAKMIAAFYTVYGAKTGRTPEEMYVAYPLRVTAASAAGKREMDQKAGLARAKDSAYNAAQQGDTQNGTERSLDFTAAPVSGEVVQRSVGGGNVAQGWAGATRIRRKDGQPATVYRGAAVPLAAEHFDLASLGVASGNASSGLGVWFTISEQEATGYGNVEPFQLDIRNPLVIKVEDLEGFDGGPAEAYAWREKQRAAGYDGLLITAKHLGGRVHIVAFDANQVIKPQDTLEQPAYHGTGRDVTPQFSLDYIGTGEGAQAYGWGLYFAENPGVAAGYHERLAGGVPLEELKLGTMRLTERNNFDYSSRATVNDVENVRASLAEDLMINEMDLRGANDKQAHVLAVLDDRIANYYDAEFDTLMIEAAKKLREELAKPGAVSAKWAPATGGVYTVDIKDEAVEKFLDWDAPLKAQTKEVRELVREELKRMKYLRPEDNGPKVLTTAWKAYRQENGGMVSTNTGEEVYNMLVRKFADEQQRGLHEANADVNKLASLYLLSKGVPGTKYLDQFSRDRKSNATRNLVVFDEGIVTITHKDGVPVSQEQRREFFQETIDNDTGIPDEAPPLYSVLNRSLEAAKLNNAPPAQWAAFIKGLSSKGVKGEEIEMSGILDWLAIRENPPTPEEVARSEGANITLTVGGESLVAALTADGHQPIHAIKIAHAIRNALAVNNADRVRQDTLTAAFESLERDYRNATTAALLDMRVAWGHLEIDLANNIVVNRFDPMLVNDSGAIANTVFGEGYSLTQVFDLYETSPRARVWIGRAISDATSNDGTAVAWNYAEDFLKARLRDRGEVDTALGQETMNVWRHMMGSNPRVVGAVTPFVKDTTALATTEQPTAVKKDVRVTKQEVLDYLAENGVKVETLILGEPKNKKPGVEVAAPVTQTREEELPDGYTIEETDDGEFSAEDPDGWNIDIFDTYEEAVQAVDDHYLNVDAEHPEVQERAERMWEDDADSRADGHREYASQSDWVQYDVEFRLPTFRVVELEPDMFRESAAYGVQWVKYENRNVKDVADLSDPEFVAATDEEFDTYREAVRWAKSESGNDEDYEFDEIEPHFIGRFAEADQETDEFDNFAEAERSAERMQSDMIDQEADNYAENDSFRDDADRYLERAAREISDEREAELASLRGQGGPRLRTAREWDDTPRVRHDRKWQSDGGRQYREMVLSVPNIEPYNANDATHFATDTKGRTVAWSRYKIHDDANGVATLYVEEWQSQRAQHGKEQGFKRTPTAAELQSLKALEDASSATEDALEVAMAAANRDLGTAWTNPRSILNQTGDNVHIDIVDRVGLSRFLEIQENVRQAYAAAEEAGNALNAGVKKIKGGNVPGAPFVKDTQAWLGLIMKRVLRYAVDNGVTQIAWTTGAQNAERYGTSDQIDLLKWTKTPEGIQIEAMKDGRVVVDRKLDAQFELGQTIGNKVAQKIINSADQSGEIASDELDSVNGLGMQSFYGDARGLDTKGKPAIVPIVANKLVKSLGGTGVETINMTVKEKGKTYNGAAGFKITPAMSEKIKGGLTLFQDEKKPRGSITFGDSMSDPSTMALLAGADLSTFLHEFGHFGLEVMADIAGQENAPQVIVDDLKATLNWFKQGMTLAEWQGMTLEQKRMYHEQFARGFEAYLFEGRAPSMELQGVFSRFRGWLINVYRALTSADPKADSEKFQADYAARVKQPLLQLTDEVRGVMDRMLATNEQILSTEAARSYAPLFKTKPDGMTDAEWVNYQETDPKATQDAVDDLQRRSLRDMQWLTGARSRELARLQKAAANRRKSIENEVREEVQQEPVYAVQRWLKFGIMPDGTETVGAKLDLAALKEMYGEDPAAPWRYLAVGRNGLAGNEGLHPDQVAEMFGFTSGDHLVRAILEAHPESSEIEGRTDQRMLERYGDLSSPAAISKAADEAVHNDARARFIATELRALDRAVNVREDTGRTTTDSKGRTRRITVAVLPKVAKEFAEMILARKKIRDLSPAQYAAAEVRAAKAAEKALAGGNLVEAATEKRNQLVNNYATRAAYDAVSEIERGLRYLKQIGDSKSLDPEYREQIDAMLDRFELRRITGKTQERRQSLLKWVEEQRANGFEPVIDEALIDEARRVNYRELSVEEFRGLVDAVKNIAHLGRLKKKLLTARDEREFEATVDGLVGGLERNAKGSVSERRISERGALVTMGRLFRQAVAIHRKFANITRGFDGWKDDGAWWNTLIRPMNERGDFETARNQRFNEAFAEIIKPVLAQGKMTEKAFFKAIGKSFTREERIGMLLNMGNETNIERVLTGERVTPDQLREIAGTLTKTDAEFVNKAWQLIDSFWPEVADKQQRVTGVVPEKVEASPFELTLANGETVQMRGGYYPIVSDPLRSERSNADINAEVQKQLERGLYVNAQTRRGHTKARVESTGRPLRYDFVNVITQHAEQVIHDLAWHEFLVDANRILRSNKIEVAVRDHYGIESLRELKDTLTDIAVGNMRIEKGAKAFNHLRSGVTIATMGFNVWNAIQNTTALTQAVPRIGGKWVLKGMAHWAGDTATLENSAKKVAGMSEFMLNRGVALNREINDIRNKVEGKAGKWEAAYFYLQTKMQLVVDIPVWWGAYEKAMAQDGMDEAKAIALADSAVRDAFGSGHLHDQAAIMRGPAGLRLLTTFGGFFNTTLNNVIEVTGRTDFKKPKDVVLAAVDMAMLWTVPSLMSTLIYTALKGDWDDEEKLVKKIIADQVSFLMGMVIGLREATAAVQAALGVGGDMGYTGPASMRLFADLAKFGKQAAQGELDEPFWRSLAGVTGTILHLPTGQVANTIDGLVAVSKGETENPGALLVGAK